MDMTRAILEGMKADGVGRSLTPSDISGFETKYDLVLPTEYQEFLLQYNGGLITGKDWANQDQGVVRVRWSPASKARRRIAGAFAGDLLKLSGSATDVSTVETELQRLREAARSRFLKEAVLPIGRDPGGLLFVIVLSGNQQGAVRLWDRTDEDDLNVDDLGVIAPSFAEFVAALEPEPEDWEGER